jgi:peptidoglycan LD-endopeptidase LytH
MRRARKRGNPVASALFACVAIGFGLGWTFRGHAPRPVESVADDLTAATTHAEPAPAQRVATTGEETAIEDLRRHNLQVPIDGADVESFKGQFADRRENGNRPHEAVDILAPRNTPVHAVESGTIAKLFFSKGGGGNTIYEFDLARRYCYYYAHLERYADGLHDGQPVARGQVIGFVGTSGNAPPNTPHLHFAVDVLGPNHQWWKGLPIDPYAVFSR